MIDARQEFRTDFLAGGRRVATSLTRYDPLGTSETELWSMPAALPEDDALLESLAGAFENAGGRPGSLTHLLRACLLAEGAGLVVRAAYPLRALAADAAGG